MSGFDVIGMCLRNLVKRKLRTFLTLLGVMIGTGSIIIMISLGLATDARFTQMLEDMNLDMTRVNVFPRHGNMDWDPDTQQMIEVEPRQITDDSVTRIAAIPGVQVATPLLHGRVVFESGPYAMEAQITGIRPEAMERMDLTTSYGRLLQDDDGFAVVFGAYAERHFFDTRSDIWWGDRFWNAFWMPGEVETFVDIYNDPIQMFIDPDVLWRRRMAMWTRGADDGGGGMEIEEAMRPARSFELEIVGVLEPMGSEWDPSPDGVIYMDIELLQNIIQMGQEESMRAGEEDENNPRFTGRTSGPRETYGEMFVRVESMDYTQRIAREIRDMGYSAWFNGDGIERERQNQQAIQTLLAAIAAISLFVAAINIANTMITSVTERTREIGIMKVIGASLMDVRRLFLTEAIVIGLLGGLFGIALALGGSYALNNFEIEFLARLNMRLPQTEGMANAAVSLITPWLLGVALAVASGVGLVSGIFPAIHATRLSALAAIRNE